MSFAPNINAARGGRTSLEPRVLHLQFSYYNKFGYGLSGAPSDGLFESKKRIIFFYILQHFTLKFDILFHFGKSDKNVIGIERTQVRVITVQQSYCNVESTCRSDVIVLLLVNALFKKQI